MKKMKDNIIWVAMQKNGTLVLFSEEPKRNESGNWYGNLYINSLFYEKLNKELKLSDMNNSWEAQPIIVDTNFQDEE